MSTVLNNTDRRHLQLISSALLAMNGRVTMLGISRWTDKGGSYRTIQRFFRRAVSWCRVNGYLIRHHLPDQDEVILIAGDTTTVTESSKPTHGLDRWFASIDNRAVPGVSFFTLSLISVKQRRALPVMTEPVEPDEPTLTASTSEKQKKSSPKQPENKKLGQLKGSGNQTQSAPELSSRLWWIPAWLRNLQQLIGAQLQPVYLVYDNALGNNEGAAMVKPLGLDLISKLRGEAALWFPYQGAY